MYQRKQKEREKKLGGVTFPGDKDWKSACTEVSQAQTAAYSYFSAAGHEKSTFESPEGQDVGEGLDYATSVWRKEVSEREDSAAWRSCNPCSVCADRFPATSSHLFP